MLVFLRSAPAAAESFERVAQAPRSQAPRLAAPSTSSRPAPAPASPPRTLLGLRLPAFIAFGVAGMSTGGALATMLAAHSTVSAADCGSKCSDARVSRSETLSSTSKVLAGVAAAGIGTGLVLVLSAPSKPERRDHVPSLRVKLSGTRAVAGVVWKF